MMKFLLRLLFVEYTMRSVEWYPQSIELTIAIPRGGATVSNPAL